jgi:hypothetical protein
MAQWKVGATAKGDLTGCVRQDMLEWNEQGEMQMSAGGKGRTRQAHDSSSRQEEPSSRPAVSGSQEVVV